MPRGASLSRHDFIQIFKNRNKTTASSFSFISFYIIKYSKIGFLLQKHLATPTTTHMHVLRRRHGRRKQVAGEVLQSHLGSIRELGGEPPETQGAVRSCRAGEEQHSCCISGERCHVRFRRRGAVPWLG